MKKIKLYIAASLDGYIARPDGGIDWLTDFPILENFDYGYADFYDSIDTIIMGGSSFRSVLNMASEWMYSGKTSYVVTRHPQTDQHEIRFIYENVNETILHLREEKGKDIWLFGGGEIITLLLNQDLVDEMIITYIPVILGNGIPLFPNNPTESHWVLSETAHFENNVLQVKYSLR